jgi:hypothetical protein
MTRAIVLVAAVAVLTGCQAEREPIPGMADTCQTKKCVCEASQVRAFDDPEPVPVLWKPTGEAYCPDDHVLRFAKQKRK